jgi:ketosteroid isomerase-like protein
MPSPQEVARALVEAINSHDPRRIVGLMTPDAEFVDSLGDGFGSDVMLEAWSEYFRMIPDFTISVEEILAREELVVLLGTAEGTYAPDGALRGENRFRVHAAWRADVRGGNVARWQVFADNKPIYDLVREARAKERP